MFKYLFDRIRFWMSSVPFKLSLDLFKRDLECWRNMWRWKPLKSWRMLINLLVRIINNSSFRPNHHWSQSSSLFIIWTWWSRRSRMHWLEKWLLHSLNVLVLDDYCLRLYQCFCFACIGDLSSWVGCQHSFKIKSWKFE